MRIENLSIGRLIAHGIPSALPGRGRPDPQLSGNLLSLPEAAINAVRDRIVLCLGSNSQAVEMDIVRSDEASTFSALSGLLSANDDLFIQESQRLARSLIDIQASRTFIPPSEFLIIEATFGALGELSLIAAIKADKHDGFRRLPADHVEFYQDLFMGSRLFKIGAFCCPTDRANDNSFWRSYVFDNNLTRTNKRNAARYFFGHFLGCEFKRTASSLNKIFFEQTIKYFNNHIEDEERRFDLANAVYTYLKVNSTATISVDEFARMHLHADEASRYKADLINAGFPDGAVSKDLSEIAHHMKRRKLKFLSGLDLVGPAEIFSKKVTIGRDMDSENSEQSIVTIRDEISTV